jgi:hypothetical protein
VLAVADPANQAGVMVRGAALNRAHFSYDTSQRSPVGRAVEYAWRTTPLADRVKPQYLDTEWCRHLRQIAGDDFDAGVLRVAAPAELIGADRWHGFVVRFCGPNLELFVDGVLLDEEWPHGMLDRFRGPFLLGAGYVDGQLARGFRGLVSHLAVWDHALDDAEVAALCGGEAEVAARASEYLGAPPAHRQYWLPPGFNTFAGDTMPFFREGEFHVYYLFDRRHHGAKWGMGAHQFAHISSPDLEQWTDHPLALPITRQWECSLGTGCVVHHGDRFRAYYIHHGKRCYFTDCPHELETILQATGPDGRQFEKDSAPVVPIDYREFGDVNPDVFPREPAGGYYLSVSGWKVFVSADLEHWAETTELRCPEDVPRGICCSYFEWNGRYYYTWDLGQYRMAPDPLGPGWRWTQPEHPATVDGLFVPKVAPFRDNRRLLVGFLGGTAWGGELVFRELVQAPDGTLGICWPPEMIPPAGEPLNLPVTALCGSAERAESGVVLDGRDGLSMVALAGVPADVRITCTVVPGEGDGAFGLCARGNGDYASGAELRFEPAVQRVQWGTPAGGDLAPCTEPPRYATDFGIGGVDFLDRPFALDVIVLRDVVDACLGGRRTIISRRPDRPTGDRLFLFSRGARVAFEDLRVRPLT